MRCTTWTTAVIYDRKIFVMTASNKLERTKF